MLYVFQYEEGVVSGYKIISYYGIITVRDICDQIRGWGPYIVLKNVTGSIMSPYQLQKGPNKITFHITFQKPSMDCRCQRKTKIRLDRETLKKVFSLESKDEKNTCRWHSLKLKRSSFLLLRGCFNIRKLIFSSARMTRSV